MSKKVKPNQDTQAGPSRPTGSSDSPGNPGNPGDGSRGRGTSPPFTRNPGLDEAQMQDALQIFEGFKNSFDFVVNENVIYLTYSEITKENVELLSDLDEWKVRVISYHEEQGRHDIRAKIEAEGFIEQMFHMLRLSGLHMRDWNLMVRSVDVDLSRDNLEKMAKMVSACRYQGFDPSVILKRIVRSWKEGRLRPREEYRISVETEHGMGDLIYSNLETLIDDMTFLILVFLNRGAVISKIAKKSARDFTSVLKMLIAKYNIRAAEEGERRTRAEAIAPEIITLPRIAACFAQLTTVLYSRGLGRAIANFAHDFPEGTPVALFSPMFPSVVRKGYHQGNVIINIHPQLILIAILNDNVLHIRDRVTPLDQIWTYYLAAHNSGVLVEAARIEQCNKFGITVEGRFIDRLLNIRQHCITRIRELRPHERIEDFIGEMNILP